MENLDEVEKLRVLLEIFQQGGMPNCKLCCETLERIIEEPRESQARQKVEWPEMMTDVQAAEFLGLRPQTLRNYRSSCRGGPKYIRLSGRAIRYHRNDLIAYRESHTIDPENG